MIDPGIILLCIFGPLVLAVCGSIVSMEIREWRDWRRERQRETERVRAREVEFGANHERSIK